MKKLFILLLSVLSLTAFAQQKKVAVYVTGQQSGINKVLGDQLVAAFAKSGKYIAIERTASFLAELGKEQNYQRTGAVDDNELSRLGKQFGVQLVCVADVSEVFGEKYISCRLIDVESAEVINTSNASSPMTNMKELLDVSNILAQELTSKTVQEKAADAWALKKEKEATEKMLLQGFENGYIKCGNLYATVTWPRTEMYNLEGAVVKPCRIGGFDDWRIPTITELAVVKQSCRNYYANKASYQNISTLNLEQLHKIFDGETFWVKDYEKASIPHMITEGYMFVVTVDGSTMTCYNCKQYHGLLLVRDAK